MTRRRLLAVPAVAALIAGGYWSIGPPRITLLNASLVVDYPWPRGAAALLCALALVGIGALLPKPALRRTCFVLALAPLLVAAHLLLYRLEASGSGLSSRGVLGTTAIAWPEVRSVIIEAGASAMVVRGESARAIRIDTSDFAPEQRATIERTVARHVREKGTGGVVAAP